MNRGGRRRRRAYSEDSKTTNGMKPIEKEKNQKIKNMWQKLTFQHSTKQHLRSTSFSLPADIGQFMPQSAPSTPKGTRKTLPQRFPSTDMLLIDKRKRNKHGFEGKFHPDVIGVTFLEICNAKDLPPGKNCKFILQCLLFINFCI
jgi:hypothetical protein